ncbi:hypothetical protein A2V68_01185 [candidate division Kazan bacterium RBG_13_50_9]|uniref:Uncharacterized protein n=1 Tax=candidate division Kazan bacterium RBG_13_50_9 TaxID=1798535 RepID=A0A1F4NSF3_UNCK3|nr:MAG: hypothetical protein A2V68_01185 [candidate division Kazan bacterium RBG_13_50_9]
MSKAAFLDWAWHYRKLLLLQGLLLGLLELLYFIPTGLGWWVVAIGVVVVLMSGWIGNLQFNKSLGLFLAELLWIVLGGIGFLSFSLLWLWQAQVIIGMIILLSAAVTYWHQNHIDYRKWSLTAINWLVPVDLLALFIVTVSLFFTVQFYNLGVFWLMSGVALQFILAMYLLFWRQGSSLKKFWLYALVLAIVGEQLTWLMHAWHKGAYFKAFLLLIVYYLYADFVAHYLKGNLTVKVIVEYIGIALFLVAILFLFDFLFLLIPNL